MYIPIKAIGPPIKVKNPGISLNIIIANIVDPIGSPNKLIATIVASTFFKIQL